MINNVKKSNIFSSAYLFLVVIVTILATSTLLSANARAAAACTGESGDTTSWTSTRTYNKGTAQCIVKSSDNKSIVYWQADGNLVWYINGVAKFASNTSGTGNMLALQADGNIVIYNKQSKAIWSSLFNLELSKPFVARTTSTVKYLMTFKSETTGKYYLAHTITDASKKQYGVIQWQIIK